MRKCAKHAPRQTKACYDAHKGTRRHRHASCARRVTHSCVRVCGRGGPQIRAGEEVTLSYGGHSNADLMLSYGFTLQVGCDAGEV
jgi:hypothetical protein